VKSWRSDHAIVAKPPQSALADSDGTTVSSASSVIYRHGRPAPGGIVAYVIRQDESGCSVGVGSGVHAAISETVMPAIRSHDLAAARADDVQLRVAWPGWLRWPAAVQRQGVPADNH